MYKFLSSFLIATLSLSSATAGVLKTSVGNVKTEIMADGLDEPWSFGFLPEGGVLITERDGNLIHLSEQGQRTKIGGLPKISANGQGGLLDLLIPSDFSKTRTLYFTYAKPQMWKSGTAVARARFQAGAPRLTKVETIFEMTWGSGGGVHFGSRLVESPDGTLFITVGDRGEDSSAQDLSRHNGSVLRINRDGSVPADNPFVGQRSVEPEIWSYGHRNPQGAALDLKGELWVNEHGAKGGDEVNKITKGRNYGWPVISYGVHYSGAKIGEGVQKDGMEQPQHYWDPSIAPSGMMFYSGRLWPEWRGDIFVGSLKFSYIARLDGAPLIEAEQIKGPETGRVRDIREAPDGSIWFLSVIDGSLIRLSPNT